MAVDGSLIFNTKIDTSGLNADIAKINQAIAQAQKKPKQVRNAQLKLQRSRRNGQLARYAEQKSGKHQQHNRRLHKQSLLQNKLHRLLRSQQKRLSKKSRIQPTNQRRMWGNRQRNPLTLLKNLLAKFLKAYPVLHQQSAKA